MLRRSALAGLLIAVGLLGSKGFADAPEPGLQFVQADQVVNAPLLDADIDIHVSGMIARATIRQSFENTSADWVEAIYRFPLPEDAAVDRLRIRVGERVIEGEIQERAQAIRAYEAAKSEGKKASLVQQSRANVFTTSLANIAPGELVTVEIEYQELVGFDNDTFSLRLPLTMTERYVSSADAARDAASEVGTTMVPSSRGHRVQLDVFIDAGMPLDLIASRYHTVSINRLSERYHVTLTDSDTKLDRDFELIWQPSAASVPRAMSFSEMRDGEPYYLVMFMPPDEQAQPLRMPREAIFIIDTSGSMQGESIGQAKKALLRALDGLQPGDLFNVIEFNSVTRPLFERSQPADDLRRQQATRFVSQLAANGGTEMAPALRLALSSETSELHLRQVVFVTDGSVANEEALFQQIERTLGSARLFTVGIGSAPNSWFMRKSAEVGRGAYTVISSTQEVAEKMDRLLAKIEAPQLNNIEMHWPTSTEVEMYPSVVPDLYSGEPVLLRIRAADMPLAPIQVAGDSPTGRWTSEISLDSEFDDFGVGALWGRARIDNLLDQQRRGANPDVVRQDVIATALKHRLVSRHTSLVAVDKTPARPIGSELASRDVPSLMPKGQLSAFPATATSAPLQRLLGLLLFGMAGILFLRERHRRVPAAA